MCLKAKAGKGEHGKASFRSTGVSTPQGAGPQPPRRQPHEVQHLVGQQAAQLEKVLILKVASQDQFLAQHQSHCWAFFCLDYRDMIVR